MVRSIRAARRFGAWRGAPPSDVAAIEDALLRIGRLAAEVPEIAEMDMNPLRVRAQGEGAVVLDARIAVRAVSLRT
jgi:acetyltransferase